jgi:hypothetical protein
MAITMLGLGLGYTTKQFMKFGNVIQIPTPEYTATYDEPIVLGSDIIKISKTKITEIPIRYYVTESLVGVYPVIVCNTTYCMTTDRRYQMMSYYDYSPGTISFPLPGVATGTPTFMSTVSKNIYLPEYSNISLKPGSQISLRIIIPKNFIPQSQVCTLEIKSYNYIYWGGATPHYYVYPRIYPCYEGYLNTSRPRLPTISYDHYKDVALSTRQIELRYE